MPAIIRTENWVRKWRNRSATTKISHQRFHLDSNHINDKEKHRIEQTKIKFSKTKLNSAFRQRIDIECVTENTIQLTQLT